MNNELGEIVIFQAEDGSTALDVQLQNETVWLSQAQMVDLFAKSKQNISLHVRNIFKEGELMEEAVVKESLTTAADGKKYRVKRYNLDVIISVGYRIKSIRGTQFRIWATSVLKDHLIKGYSLNERRLAEKGLLEMEQAVSLLSSTLRRNELVTEQGSAVLEIVTSYAKTWSLLLQYDEDRLLLPKGKSKKKHGIDYQEVKGAIASLKSKLFACNEATELFGQEREHHLEGILGNIMQTFGGEELYPTTEQKAAHLLYFIIKDHPFVDGNKRIGSFVFLLFLQDNDMLDQSGINQNGLVALTLLVAESDAGQKELMIRLILNLLTN
ncbi:virulence protein RhuM/Fic/DOC family protein [Desulfosediminicola flagellatus]|uniref:virulence protein RhuM/Fic/DOC family protein n=1 Tax=Desulfosediminicola flagellatus TaxID=2569541 RepID=UPI0010AB99CC|nr:virulence protein RhuM/Fic/DOC family protein [Desulfosediminicola flagellatus]